MLEKKTKFFVRINVEQRSGGSTESRQAPKLDCPSSFQALLDSEIKELRRAVFLTNEGIPDFPLISFKQ